jgi:hypothetical protein
VEAANARTRLSQARMRQDIAQSQYDTLEGGRPTGLRHLWSQITGKNELAAVRLTRSAAVCEKHKALVERSEIVALAADTRLATAETRWTRERADLERERATRRRALTTDLLWFQDALRALAADPDLALRPREDIVAAGVIGWRTAFREPEENFTSDFAHPRPRT